MKKNLLSSALLLLLYSAHAQTPTSQEEYNYATKGLLIQRNSGLDMKAGYELVNPLKCTYGTFTIVIEDLTRKADSSLACTIVEVSSTNYHYAAGPIYLCIPTLKTPQALLSQSTQAMQAYASDFQRAVNYALATRVAQVTSASYAKK